MREWCYSQKQRVDIENLLRILAADEAEVAAVLANLPETVENLVL